MIVLSVLVIIKGIINLVMPITPKNITGKVALVTGGGNGRGQLICIRLAQEGCNVAIIDVDISNAEMVAKHLSTRFGVKSKAYFCDVTDYDKLEECRDLIKVDLGIVTILVNNAGVVPYISFREKHWTDVDKILKINLNSHLWATRVFLDDMVNAKNGHIVPISSMATKISAPYFTTYITSKYGVNGFMSCLAEELWAEGHDKYIKTTTVYPYFINTRKDLLDVVNLRFPPLDPVKTANRIVDAVLRDEEHVMIPRSLWVANLVHFVPISIQRLGSDILFNIRTLKIRRVE